ncbi:unnamed protein product [Cylindrotheca closterium]|uniref:Uncharacterized protein n=1 Tax=Cylindrotheca closterium TaxID=2856 RepID=A0AAD2CPX5_9STRA|nr:unnamed protein product [Cylindrotheca closterium]
MSSHRLIYDEDGIANVLAMREMIAAGYRITMDTDFDNAFVVHCDGDRQMRFVNRKGVYVLEQLGADVEAGAKETNAMYCRQLSSVNKQPHFELSSKQNGYAGLGMTAKMATVRKNKEGFTRRQVKATMEARSAMHILNAPSTKSLKCAIRFGLIKGCPITEEAINHVEAIFGPDASTLKGKSTRPTPKKTHYDFFSPPEELYQHNHMEIGDATFLTCIDTTVRYRSCIPMQNLKTDPVFAPEGSSTTSRRYAPAPSHPSCPWWTAPLPSDVLRATTAAELCTDHYGWVPDEIEVHSEEATLADALLEGRLRVISDGSFKNELGTAAVQLLVKHGGCHRIIIRCQTPGLPQDQSQYGSELIGLLACIMAVDWLLQQWFPNLSTCPKVRIACDGLSAIEMAFEDRPLSPTDAQFDLVSSIWEAILRSLVDWSPQHVYGHLDKSNLFDELSWWEKRNLEVDGMAVEYRKELEMANHLIAPNPRFFTELAALYMADTKQSRLVPQFIQECGTLPALRSRWRDKGTISAAAES